MVGKRKVKKPDTKKLRKFWGIKVVIYSINKFDLLCVYLVILFHSFKASSPP